MELTDTISIIEVIWLGVTMIGFLLSLWTTWDAYTDVQLLRDHELNGLREIIAHGIFVNDIMRTLVLFFFTTAGIVSMTYGTNQAPIWGRVYVVSTIILGAVLLVLKAANDRRVRQKVIKYEAANELASRDVQEEETDGSAS